ncbi:uncharacterized protein LOC6535942 isoform X27 [Drosophila yakuba]|nr:uncharacterized protein LOC6535942 isoform X27 [Drosophila yakuba]
MVHGHKMFAVDWHPNRSASAPWTTGIAFGTIGPRAAMFCSTTDIAMIDGPTTTTSYIGELAVFGTGQRGRTVLLFQNEKFVKNRCSASRTYWICSKKDVTVCRARVVTAVDKNAQERIIKCTYEHDHSRKFPSNNLNLPVLIRREKKALSLDSSKAYI